MILDRYYKGFRNNVAAAIGEHSDIYSSVVSGQFDADRLDYMQRDRMMTEDHPICKFVKGMHSWQSSLLLDDTVIWGMLEQLRGAGDRNIRELSERLYNRKLFKSIKMPIKDVLIKNNIKKKEQDKEEIIKRFLNKAYPDLLSDIKNWNDEHSNVSDKIFMDMVRRGSYNNPKANRSRSNQILAVDEKQRIVSLTDISDVVRSIGPFVEIRGYVSEYGGDAENYLKDRVKNYKMTEVA